MRSISSSRIKRLLSVLSPALSGLSQDSMSSCTKLLSLLPENVFFPDTANYSASIASYYALQERLNPDCIVIPSSAEDVATAVKLLAKLPDAIFAIRGGGHSTNVGAANVNGGITIDLQQINNVQVSYDGSVAAVGAGDRWGNVSRVLDPLGLGVVGGKLSTVGVGGLITGGGLSSFSPLRGFACDNVLNMQVVLASGEIVDANDTNEYMDLFVALKGGQNNFGVVTRFDLQTFPQGDYWGGIIMYPSSTVDDQLAAYATFKGQSDPLAEVEQSFYYNSSAPGDDDMFTLNVMYNAEPVVNASALRMFSDIQPQMFSSMRISTATDFTEEGSLLQPKDSYALHATTTFRFSSTILPQVHKLWVGYCRSEALWGIPDLRIAMTFMDMPPQLPNSRNSLGFPPGSHPEIDQIICLFTIHWAAEEDSAAVECATQTLLRNIDTLTESQGLGIRYRYLNWATSWQDPLRRYGEESLEEMRRVAGKYDPYRVFQNKVPGGFKLPVRG